MNMSYVCDIVLLTEINDGDGDGDDAHPNVDKLNEWLDHRHGSGKGSAYLQKVDQHSGGNKAMQCDVFVAAVNYLDVDGFIHAFRQIQWGNRYSAQLLLKNENEERFTLYEANP